MSDALEKCTICQFSEQNELEYGQWKTSDDVQIHHFCALLAKDSVQRGDDDDGIEGFLLDDIKDLRKTIRKRICYYCHKKSASIKCAEKGCARWWHVVCSVKNKCLSIFENDHISYCHKHVKITEKYPTHADWWSCQICRNPMGDYNPITSIPSCCNQGYYHRNCMQKMAIHAGYVTKCPSCGYASPDDNDPDGYRKFLRSRGVFCPDKDADWELSPEAYNSLLYVHERCDAAECKCPKDREFNGRKNGKWKLLKCAVCGGKGVHVGCRDEVETETDNTDQFMCDDCHVKSFRSITGEDESMDSQHLEQSSTTEEVADADNLARLTIPRRNQTQPQGNNDDAIMVLKKVRTNKTVSRKEILCLVNLKEDTHADPLGDEERGEQRQSRLDHFFRKANFDSKPPPPPWLL